MSLLESATKGWGGGILVGIGAALVLFLLTPPIRRLMGEVN